jgi:flagellar protein FlbD
LNILNAELIRYVEARPDTFITLTTNERLVVKEPLDEVVRRSIEYQRAKHLFPATIGANPLKSSRTSEAAASATT